jgi:surfeit locus 1 family protein
MRIAGSDFKPRLVPTLAALFVLSATLALGNWQLNRAKEKRALQARYDRLSQDAPIAMPSQLVDPKDYQFRRVEVEGAFAPKYQIFLDNQISHGVVGYHVLTPMRIGVGSFYVLVDRGWIARGEHRTELPSVTTSLQPLRLEGIAVVPSKKFLELSSDTVEGSIWQNVVLERYQKVVPFQVQPVVIEQVNDTGDGLVREWLRPDTGVERHLGYAFQWFAMALATVILYVVLNAKRGDKKDNAGTN